MNYGSSFSWLPMQEKKKGCASAEDYFKVGDFQDRLKNVNLKLKFA